MNDVTIHNYVQLATRSEAPITDEIIARLSNPVIASALMGWFEQFAAAAKNLDYLKKYIFYGKELPPSFECLDGYFDPKMDRLLDRRNLRILHAILGLCTEPGELVRDQEKDGTKKGIYWFLVGKIELDEVNLLEECGDITWYFALMCAVLNGTPISVLQRNIDKLRERYPDKFTEVNALLRDLDAERLILEGRAC